VIPIYRDPIKLSTIWLIVEVDVITSQMVGANGSPDDKLREAFHIPARPSMDYFVALRLAMTGPHLNQL